MTTCGSLMVRNYGSVVNNIISIVIIFIEYNFIMCINQNRESEKLQMEQGYKEQIAICLKNTI